MSDVVDSLTPDDAELLAITIARVLQQARSVSDSEHYDHHRWITEKIRREQAWRIFWEKMGEHAAKWGMISLFSFSFYALWLGLKAILHMNGFNE